MARWASGWICRRALARVAGPGTPRDMTQCTPLRLAPATLVLSLEAVSRTSLENFLGFLGAAGMTSVPGSGMVPGQPSHSRPPARWAQAGASLDPGPVPQATLSPQQVDFSYSQASNLEFSGSVLV